MSKPKQPSKVAGKSKKLTLRRETIKDIDLPADQRGKVRGGRSSGVASVGTGG